MRLKSSLVCFVLWMLFISMDANAQIRTYIMDAQNSVIRWKGYKIYKSDNTAHYGTLKIKHGFIKTDAAAHFQEAAVTVDMHSLEDLDLASDPGDKSTLEFHLKSEDFFYVDSFPEAYINVNSASPTGKTDEYIFKGKLKIKYTELPITFVGILKYPNNNFEWIIDEIIINRQDYKIRMEDSLKDELILDELDLQVYITGK